MEQVLVERLREITPSLESPAPIGTSGGPRASEPTGGRFAELVTGLLAEVNEKQNVAADNAEGLAKGEVGITDTVVALNEADLSLRMMMQIRDRAIDAYQRILRTI